MLEKSYYDWSDVAEVNTMIIPAESNRLEFNLEDHHNSHFTVMDLVSVFEDEADKICMNKRVAHLIALDALNDYVEGHVNNVKIS
ncbi:MAG: hypothetical protein R2568_10720 [Candidatus Scalindua sp.]|jgi:hypothetical protein|nr:hypothetical protein [Candidatus Scalindua sp.]MDV5167199.1 hypothetical protein [Candidatus Scalindua sp.]